MVGAACVIALEAALLLLFNSVSDRTYLPRGAGWLIAPIVLGISTGSAAPLVWLRLKQGDSAIARKVQSPPVLWRAYVVFALLWVASVGAYVWLFEPYGYMSSRDYSHMLKIMLFPPIVTIVGLLLYRKLVKPS
jgi:hypothetical protein